MLHISGLVSAYLPRLCFLRGYIKTEKNRSMLEISLSMKANEHVYLYEKM